MPGIRFLLKLEMYQVSLPKGEQKACELAGEGASGDAIQSHSKRARRATEPLTPENEPIQRNARVATATALPGNLIHLSQSSDGKLRWLPPSSSTSSINEGKPFSCCLSGESGPVSTVSSGLMKAERTNSISSNTKMPSKSKPASEQESSEMGPASPSLTSCFWGRVGSDSSIIHSVETVDSDMHEVSVGLDCQVASSSEVSISLLQPDAVRGSNKLIASGRNPLPHGLSPYLSSKLKPGKHILGVKKQQVYIRPGQLRHWAVGNSPSLATNLANLPAAAALKGKACRTLTF